MVGQHHQLNGHEFEQNPGAGKGQGNQACCSPWGCRVRHNWATEQEQLPKPDTVHISYLHESCLLVWILLCLQVMLHIMTPTMSMWALGREPPLLSDLASTFLSSYIQGLQKLSQRSEFSKLRSTNTWTLPLWWKLFTNRRLWLCLWAVFSWLLQIFPCIPIWQAWSGVQCGVVESLWVHSGGHSAGRENFSAGYLFIDWFLPFLS